MTETATKRFTVEEANRTLPLVSRIVTDIVADYRRWKECMHHYEIRAARSGADEEESEEQLALQQTVEQLARQIDGYIRELTQVGCEFKGFEEGLVDFRSTLSGRDVLLCWKLGEPAIGFWHELDAGYAERQVLEPEFAKGE